MLRPIRAAGVLIVSAVCLLAPAAPSSAGVTDITASQVTTHGFGKHYLYDGTLPSAATNPANQRTVSGTATGSVGAPIDVGCLQGPNWMSIGTTSLRQDQTWTVTGSLMSGSGPCALRAVPQNRPADLSPFQAAAAFYPSLFRLESADTTPYAYVFSHQREHGAGSIESAAYCGLCSMRWRDDEGALSESVFVVGGWLGSYGFDADGSGPATSTSLPSLTVDGTRANLPSERRFDTTKPGFVPLTASATLDPSSGAVKVVSTEALLTCSPSCASAVTDTGVRLERTMTWDDAGQTVRIVDVIRNTSAASRELGVAYVAGIEGNTPGVRLPGESDFSSRKHQIVALDPAPVVSLRVKPEAAEGHDPLTNPVGAVVVSPAPQDVLFASSAFPVLRYGFTLAPGASRTFRQTYATGGSASATDQLAVDAEERSRPPALALTAPADGGSVDTATTSVSGTLAYGGKLSSFEVNGKPVTVTNGAWSTTVGLTEGSNTITAVARDADGGETTATRTITYAPKKATDPPRQEQPPVVAPGPAPAPLVSVPAPLVSVHAPTATTSTAGDPKTTFKKGIATIATGLTVACPAGGPACTSEVVAKAPLPRSRRSKGRAPVRTVIGRAKLTVPAGATLPVKLKLTRSGSRALKRAGSLRVLVTVLTKVGTANASESYSVLRIRAL